ncbi:tetratricopeptide repeat protein [Candidatus Acetothermia bacterium]|nr:tetratricopeptide repeat protein [Candidatus Acetothermia bacterium]
MGLRIQLFGNFQIWRDDELIPSEAWETKIAKSILKILLTEPGRVFSQDELLEYLWPDLDPKKASASLRVRLSELRHVLEPDLKRKKGTPSSYILTRPTGYCFNTESEHSLDTQEFSEFADQGKAFEQAEKFEEAIKTYERAAELYQGNFLAEDHYADWALPYTEKWRQAFLSVLAQLADCHARLGQYQRAIARCRQVQRIEAHREEIYRQLMLYYYLSGNQNEALQTFEQCRKALADSLDVEPSPATQELYQQILRREIPGIDEKYQPASVQRQAIPYSLGRTPFVGRTKEYAELVHYLKEAQNGHGHFVLVNGEAGVGKTRLIQEAIAYVQHQWAKDKKIKTWTGKSQDLEIKLAYQPILEALRQGLAALQLSNLESIPSRWLAEVAELVPELRELAPNLPKKTETSINPEQARSQLFEGLAQFLLGIAQPTFLVLFLDDVQWADSGTIDFLHYFLPQLENSKILLLGTCRSEEIFSNKPLQRLMQLGSRTGLLHQIELQRLPATAVAEFLEKLAPALPSSHRELFSQQIYHETEGNPFFIVSILQNCFEEGALQITPEGAWTPVPMESSRALMLPREIQEAIQRRVQRLGEREQELLRVAAVAGHRFEFELLQSAWGAPEVDTLEALEGLLSAQLVIQADNTYQFGHDKIREVVYESVSAPRRRLWHKRSGESVEKLYQKRLEEHYGFIAHHYARAGEFDIAWKYMTLALERCVKRYQHKEGLELVERGLELLKESEARYSEKEIWERRFAILAKRVEMNRILADREKEAADISELFELAQKLNDEAKLAQAHESRCRLYLNTGKYPEGLSEGQHALALRRNLQDKNGEGMALLLLGVIHQYLGEYQMALDHYEQAHKIRKELEDKAGEAAVLNNIGTIHDALGAYDLALQSYQETYQIRKALENKRGEEMALANIGLVYRNLGRYSEALEHYRQAYRLCLEIRDKRGEALILANIGDAFRHQQDYAEAIEHYRKAHELYREMQSRREEAQILHSLAQVYYCLNDTPKALEHWLQAADLIKQLNAKDLRIKNLIQRSLIHLKGGEPDQALLCSTQAIELLKSENLAVEDLPLLYYVHSRALHENHQQEESQCYLQKAQEALSYRAAKIKDSALRDSFLHNVEDHRLILEAGK